MSNIKIKRTLPSLLDQIQLSPLKQLNFRNQLSRKSIQSPQKSHIQILDEPPTQSKKQIENLYNRRKRIFTSDHLKKKKSNNLDTSLVRNNIQVIQNQNKEQLSKKDQIISFQNFNDELLDKRKRVSFSQYNSNRTSFVKKQNAQEKSISKQTQQYLQQRQRIGSFNNTNRSSFIINNRRDNNGNNKELQAQEMIQKINYLQNNLKKLQNDLHSKTIKSGSKGTSTNSYGNFSGNATDRSIVQLLFKDSRKSNQQFEYIIKSYEQKSQEKDSKLKFLQMQLQRMNRCQRLAKQNQMLFEGLKQSLIQQNKRMEESFIGISAQNSNRFNINENYHQYHDSFYQRKGQRKKKIQLSNKKYKKDSDMIWPVNDFQDQINEKSFQGLDQQDYSRDKSVQKRNFYYNRSPSQDINRSSSRRQIFSPLNTPLNSSSKNYLVQNSDYHRLQRPKSSMLLKTNLNNSTNNLNLNNMQYQRRSISPNQFIIDPKPNSNSNNPTEVINYNSHFSNNSQIISNRLQYYPSFSNLLPNQRNTNMNNLQYIPNRTVQISRNTIVTTHSPHHFQNSQMQNMIKTQPQRFPIINQKEHKNNYNVSFNHQNSSTNRNILRTNIIPR